MVAIVVSIAVDMVMSGGSYRRLRLRGRLILNINIRIQRQSQSAFAPGSPRIWSWLF